MNSNTHLLAQLQLARQRSDCLFTVLAPGAIYERAVSERHRFIFYLGHLEAFDWNLLGIRTLALPSFHPEWDRLFAFGIDPESNALPTDEASDWPAEEAVRSYGGRTRQAIDAAINAAPETLDPRLLHVAIEHRLMHLETLAYLLHNLDFASKRGCDEPVDSAGKSPENPLIEIPAGTVTLGQQSGAFGWDNEFPAHRTTVGHFAMQRYKVTNGEYLRFVEQGAAVPHFWRQRGAEWQLRLMFGEVPLPLDWPVYVSHREASAYAAWRGMRLPSEAEFHNAAFGPGPTNDPAERAYPWGDAPPSPACANADFHRWNPCPVNAHPAGDSALGLAQLVGNGWEWTSTPFAPFHGFAPFAFYPGYSADFFDGKHFVLKGASSQTAQPLLRRSFRNWFREEYAYAFAGFRCVAD